MTFDLRRGIVSVLGLLMLAMLAACDESLAFGSAADWPPVVGKPFPEIEFTNYDGKKLRISDFRGKVVLVEPVGMTCRACNAFSGGQRLGGIGNIRPQDGLQSLEDYLDRFGGISLGHPDVVLVQVILYDLSEQQVDFEEVQIWAEHFGFDRDPDVYVVFSERDLRGRESLRMIPGVYLVDRDSVVRYDATGHKPRHNLFTELLPAVPQLVRR